MTVKELKEKLEILIEEGKQDYTIIIDGLSESDGFDIDIDDNYKEVVL